MMDNLNIENPLWQLDSNAADVGGLKKLIMAVEASDHRYGICPKISTLEYTTLH